MNKSVKIPPPAGSASRASSQPVVDDVVATVVSNAFVSDSYKHLVLQASQAASFAAAGQFFHLVCPHTESDKPFLRRPMSIYKADSDLRQVEFLYKIAGAGTRGLATLGPRQTLRLLGPLGIGFSVDPSRKHIVVLGRGVGLATLAPLAELAAARGLRTTAILSARCPAYVMSVERFEAAGARVEVVLDSDGSSALSGVERLLRNLVQMHGADAFFTCGSNRLMLLMQKLGREFGIPGQVALEQQMACGLGMCFCCVRAFKTAQGNESRRVCIEGPVFQLEEALSW